MSGAGQLAPMMSFDRLKLRLASPSQMMDPRSRRGSWATDCRLDQTSIRRCKAAVDHHRGTRDPFRFVAREEERHICDIVGMTRALHCLNLREKHFGGLLTAGNPIREQGSVDAAGADAVDANLVLTDLERDRARQIDDGRLRSAV